MTLDPALIPTDTAVSTYALIRDETAERKAATFLLGDNLERTTQGGGIYTYTSQQGAAAFRDTGSFDAAGSLSQENAEAFCRDFCKAFSYDTPIFTLDETGSGTATGCPPVERYAGVQRRRHLYHRSGPRPVRQRLLCCRRPARRPPPGKSPSPPSPP